MVNTIAREVHNNDAITYFFNADWDWKTFEQALYQGVTVLNNTPATMTLVLDLTDVTAKNPDMPDSIDRIPPIFLPSNACIIIVGGTLLAKNIFYHLHFRYHTERHPVLLAELSEDVANLIHVHQTSAAIPRV